MRKAFRAHEQARRGRRAQEIVERAVLVIGLKQAVEREQRREQCRHPKDTGADGGKRLRLGADAERKQRDDESEECEYGRCVAALAQRQAEIAP
jgi:hypothetical protein